MQPLTNIKAQTLAAALKMILGYQPQITETPDGRAVLVFNTQDIPKIRRALQAMAFKAGKTGGDVSVNIMPVVAPMALKYVAPVVVGLVAAGAITGYLMARK
jgi:hypothetical protein